MPIEARRIALHVYLLLIVTSGTLMGALGFVVGLFLPPDDLLGRVLTPGGALGVMLSALGLYCCLNGRCRLKGSLALAVMMLGGLSLWDQLFPPLAPVHPLLARLGSSSLPMALMLLATGPCLLLGKESPRGRRCWRGTGAVALVAGALLMLLQWTGEAAAWQGAHPAASTIVSLYLVVFGLALWLATGLDGPLALGRGAYLIGTLGMGITCLGWYLLSLSHHLELRQQSGQTGENMAAAVAEVVAGHVQLLHRLGERTAPTASREPQASHRLDAASYLRDFNSIKFLWLADGDGAVIWRLHQPDAGVDPLAAGSAALHDWLRVPSPEPRLLVLSGLYPEPDPAAILISLPLAAAPEPGMQLLAKVSLTEVLRHNVHMKLAPFAVHAYLDGRELLDLSESGSHRHGLELARRGLRLPHGPELTLVTYLDDRRALALAAHLRLLMALTGFFLSFLAAISFELAKLSRRKGQALQQARQHLERQQGIEQMISRGQPLATILDEICRLLAVQLPGSRAEVVMAPAGREGEGEWYPVLSGGGAELGGLRIVPGEGEPGRERQQHVENAVALVALALEREQNHRLLLENEQRYRSLFDYNPDAVFSLDLEGIFTSVNPAFCELLMLTADSVVGRSFRLLVEPAEQALAEQAFRQVVTGLARRYQLTADNGRGIRVDLDVTKLPIVVNGRITGVYGIAKDITRQQEDARRLAHHAGHDALTGLPNRSLLEQRMALLGRGQGTLVVMFIDLDGFKPINDSLGHGVGDRLLVEVARRLEGLMSVNDMVARFGGDEFVALLAGLDGPEAAERLARRVLAALAQPYRIGHNELFITASIGLAGRAAERNEAGPLLQQADMAMYEAKRQGRNHWQWYNEALNSVMVRRVVLRNELQDAIDHHHLELYYQPLFNRQGEVPGVEALLRWKHPHKGYISPAEFIPLAEETGQIIAISEWVMARACRDAAQLRELGDYRVAVNLSPLQFYRSSFLDTLRAKLREAALPASALELELTEGILMDDAQHAITLLEEIRAMGIRVAIDDFGTGFSSLSYLKHLPVHKVKIDRSFIQDVTEASHDAAIVRGIMVMAHELDLEVVAEGIETRAQFERLRGDGCDLFQGFYFARPMPLDQLRSFLLETRSAHLTTVNK
jgi:diguanylate cyclase (GGDEF)-like protein/PAS domain S-box-containing protein